MELSLTITEAAKKFPDSKAYAFKLGNNQNTYYFRLAEPKFMKPNSTIRCKVKCLRFNTIKSRLSICIVPIANDENITNLTIKDFVDVIDKSIEVANKHTDIETLNHLSSYGFFSKKDQ
jgi:hypothetical protein